MFKKIILAALVVASAVFAQTGVKFGAHAGFNYGSVWGDNKDKFGFEGGPGFTGGVDAKIAISPTFFIVTGLEFENRSVDWNIRKMYQNFPDVSDEFGGSDMSYSDLNMIMNLTISFSLSYLNIPVLARFYPVPKFYLDAGAYLGFNVSSSMDISISYIGGYSMDTPSQMKKDMDFGIIVGLGYSVSPMFDLYARYSMGFVDMVDVVKFASITGEEDIDYSDAPNVGFKNMRFQIGVSFWFN